MAACNWWTISSGIFFKSRYYPNGTFLTTKEGYQPSYAWKNILSARDLVEKGGNWKIGNGRQVRIWGDKWLPDLQSIVHNNVVLPLPLDALVSDLIDEESRQWNRELISACFERSVAQKILGIPILIRLPFDKLVWYWEINSEYSVRSVYHSICDEKSRLQRSTSSQQSKKFGEHQSPTNSKISCGVSQKTFSQQGQTSKRNVSPLTLCALYVTMRLNPQPICF